jgi:inosine-uridine nucleoside N-ribohydrolase
VASRTPIRGATLAAVAAAGAVFAAGGAFAEPPTTSPPIPMIPVPVIIDTDIGDDIDDAFALVLALSDPRLTVIGVTTAWGDTRTRVLLVRRLLAAMGRQDVAVARGPATEDPVPFTQKQWAMGAADSRPAPNAIGFIRDQARARPGEITLIALAPLANVRALLERDPAAFRDLRQIVMMGGSIARGYAMAGATAPGRPSAEYNVARAPAALAAVLAAYADGGPPVTLFPLDSTQVPLNDADRTRLFAQGSAAAGALAGLYDQWRALNIWKQVTPTLFDVVPVAWLIDPSICAPVPMRIDIDARGFTRPVAGAPNARVCMTAAPDAVRHLLMRGLGGDPASEP